MLSLVILTDNEGSDHCRKNLHNPLRPVVLWYTSFLVLLIFTLDFPQIFCYSNHKNKETQLGSEEEEES